jgi:hypothetical protein
MTSWQNYVTRKEGGYYGTTHSSVSVRSVIKKIYIYFHSIFFLFR